MTTTLPHLTGDAASLYIEHIIVLEVALPELREWLTMSGKSYNTVIVLSDEDGEVSLDIKDSWDSIISYWSVEEARRIVDAINAAITYVESSKGGAQ